MQRPSTTRPHGAPTTSWLDAEMESGEYLYCVAPCSQDLSLGPSGIEGHEVRTIAAGEVCIVAHQCIPGPYPTDDLDWLKTAVMAHHRTVEECWRLWGSVLPFAFNNIVGPVEGDSTETVRRWLWKEGPQLRRRLDYLSGKGEFSVQLSWDLRQAADDLVQDSPDLRQLQMEIGHSSRARQHLLRLSLEKKLRAGLQARAVIVARDFVSRLRLIVEDFRTEHSRKLEDGHPMLLNLSCLLRQDRCVELEEEVKRLSKDGRLEIRVAGPFPPYSFCQ